MSTTSILVIDDDRELGELLVRYLARYDMTVTVATEPEAGLERVRKQDFALVILDVMLPRMDGFQVIKAIRKFNAVPVIMLTARGEVTDKIVGLELGADDYLAKPFEPRELVARIQTVLRRLEAPQRHRVRSGELEIDFGKQQAMIAGDPIDLTTKEFEVLQLLIGNAGSILSRDEIMERTRGIDWDAYNRSIDITVSRLRTKLRDDPKRSQFIKTVRGAGYMFIGELAEDAG